MNFTKNIATTMIFRGLYIIIGLIFTVLVARNFGPEGRGIITIMGTISTVAVQFANLGLANALTYFSAKEPLKSKEFAYNSLILGVVVSIIASLIILIIFTIHPSVFGSLDQKFLYIAIFSIPVILISQYFYNIILGRERIFILNIIQVISQAVLVIGGAILILFLKSSIFLVSIIALIVAPLVVLIGYSLAIFGEDVEVTANFKILEEPFKYGFKLFIISTITFLVLKSDLFLVNYFLNLKEVGFYSIASSFADYLSLTPVIIGMILFPRATILGDNSSEFVAKVSRVTTAIMIILCVAAAIIAKPVIIILYGREFLPSLYPFLILVPGVFFWSLSIIYNNYFASRKKLWFPIIFSVASLIINISLNIIFIPEFGIFAAALTSSTAYFIVFIAGIVYTNKISGRSFSDLLNVKIEDIKEFASDISI